MKTRRTVLQLALIALFFTGVQVLPSSAADDKPMIMCKIKINAPMQKVFKAIQDERKGDWPEFGNMHRDYLSYKNKIGTIREITHNLITGDVTSIWEEYEVSLGRIDFKLTESTKFKEGYGAWLLSPLDNNSATEVQIQCYFDPGLRFPLWQKIMHSELKSDLKKRLQNLKHDAEPKK